MSVSGRVWENRGSSWLSRSSNEEVREASFAFSFVVSEVIS